MHRRPSFDLGYAHETASTPGFEPTSTTRAARDLSTRLRCLKKLVDAERNERAGVDARRREMH